MVALTIAGMVLATAIIVGLIIRRLRTRHAAMMAELVDPSGQPRLLSEVEAMRDAVIALNESLAAATQRYSEDGVSGNQELGDEDPSASPSGMVSPTDRGAIEPVGDSALRRKLRATRGEAPSVRALELLAELAEDLRPGDPVRAMVLRRAAFLCAVSDYSDSSEYLHVLTHIERPLARDVRGHSEVAVEAFKYWCDREYVLTRQYRDLPWGPKFEYRQDLLTFLRPHTWQHDVIIDADVSVSPGRESERWTDDRPTQALAW